jgi:hypothetical protein
VTDEAVTDDTVTHERASEETDGLEDTVETSADETTEDNDEAVEKGKDE